MLPAKRRAKILELVRREGMSSLKDLSESLDISISTARRDVEYLAQSGHLARTHGGAMLHENHFKVFEPDRDIASAMESAAKLAIGQRAGDLIQPGQCVIFDSGSTTMAAAQAASARGIPFTAFTNDLGIASILAANSAIQTFVCAGHVRAGTLTLLGGEAVQSVARLRADIAFVGTHALTADELSDTSIELAEIKRAIIAAADLVVLLADSTKMFNRAFCSFGRTSDLDLIITDTRIKSEAMAALAERGVPIETVRETLV